MTASLLLLSSVAPQEPRQAAAHLIDQHQQQTSTGAGVYLSCSPKMADISGGYSGRARGTTVFRNVSSSGVSWSRFSGGNPKPDFSVMVYKGSPQDPESRIQQQSGINVE